MEKLLPDTLPEDAAPLSEASQIATSSVYLCDFFGMDGKNVHVMFNDGETLTGMIHGFIGSTFVVGNTPDRRMVKDITYFREV